MHSGGSSIFQWIVKLSVLARTPILSICLPSEFPPTSQRWHSPSQTCPSSKKELAVTFLLSCILIFISRIYGIRLIVIIILSSRLRSVSNRDEWDRRAGDDAAARQPSYRGALSFQRLKPVRVTTKTKHSHFHQPCPLSSFHFLYGNIRYPLCNFLCLFPSPSPSPSPRPQYLSLSLSATIRRLIRLSWLFSGAHCWWCSSTGEAGGWVAAIRMW